jgi:hypothetical protein
MPKWPAVVASLDPEPGKQGAELGMSNHWDFHAFGSAFFKTKRHSFAVDFPQEVRILPGIVLYFLESVEVIRSGSGAIDGKSTVLIRMGGASSVLTLDAIPFFPVVEPVRNRVSPSPAIQRFRSAADNAHTVS